MPFVKVRSTKALTRWDLSSQHVISTIVSFLKVGINAFNHVICCPLFDAQSNYVNRTRNECICIHELSQFGLCLGRILMVYFPFIVANDINYGLK